MISACKIYEYFYMKYNIINNLYNHVYCTQYFIVADVHCILRVNSIRRHTDWHGRRSAGVSGSPNTWRTTHVHTVLYCMHGLRFRAFLANHVTVQLKKDK